ncbi:MAG TPA: cytochrome c [Bacteroidota bacterium]|nr:cytochrome c [Bacteroidota bacterium]
MKIFAFVSIIAMSAAVMSCGPDRNRIVEPKLSSIQQEVFHESCSASSCHGSGKKGDLSLLSGDSYRQLVGVASTVDKKNSPPFLRVKPGSPDSSLLYIKIVGPDSSQGEIMPKGKDRLTPNEINAIRQWILDGAPNN